MHLLLLILLVSCSHHRPVDRQLSSYGDSSLKAQRLETYLKDELIFASGVDSTVLFVKVFDAEGALSTSINPAELSIISSDDIEAKPFTIKQGVYQATLLPRVKSKNLRLSVESADHVISNTVVLHTTNKPLKNELAPVFHDQLESHSIGEVNVLRGNFSREGFSEGFSFVNVGVNRIVPNDTNSRTFTLEYPEQARQNLALIVEDQLAAETEGMISLWMFFPRKNLPYVEQLSGIIELTIPTGEKVIFQKDSKEIVAGVLEEWPIKINKNGSFKFPMLKYKGRGVYLRADGQGENPQVNSDENPVVTIVHAPSGKLCQRPKEDFWESINANLMEFKFADDDSFNLYIQQHCGFSLPEL
jgi:hypothetical protein